MSTSRRIASAVAWNVTAGVGARVVGLVGTLVLARFVAPGEYGQVSVAAICVMTTMQVTNLQLGQYLIVNKHTAKDAAFTATVIHVGLGLLALALVFGARDVLGPWLNAPGMARFVPGFVLAQALERVAQMPERLLARDLRFRLISLTRGLGELCFTALAVATAPSVGGMGIVIGNVGRAAFVLAVFAVAGDRDWMKPVLTTWAKTRDMFVYCLPLALANLTDFAAGKWDNLLVSRYHGAGVAGAYNLAFNLSATSTGTLADQILDVLFPSFTSVEPRHRGRALGRAMASMSLLVMPLGLGLSCVAGTVVRALFKPEWATIGPMLTVLGIQAVVLPLSWTLQAYCRAEHRTRIVMVSSIVRLVVLLGGLVLIGPIGPLWACVAVNLSAVASLAVVWGMLTPGYRPLMRSVAAGVMRPVIACVPMGLAVLAVHYSFEQFGPVAAWKMLGPEVVAGAAGYALGAFIFARSTATDVITLGRQMIGRRPTAA